MEQLALYREWRPQVFGDVIGQKHVSRTLQNAVLLGRIAHAYLFCGPRGTGKTSTARILAKALNCQDLQDGEPCNQCNSCQSIMSGMSLNVIEMDAASHRGIEEIRDLKQKVGMAPSGGRYKVYIIDEVHMLTGEAFNALLKTLEEPPAHAVFILATTEAHKVPLTILSRCQRFDFRRLARATINAHLTKVAAAKDWSVEDAALGLISRQAGGSLRDALGLLDQAASFTEGRIRCQDIELLTGALGEDALDGIVSSIASGDVLVLIERLDDLFARGCEPRQVLLQLAEYVRDLIFVQGKRPAERRFYARLLRGIAAAEVEMRGSMRPDLILELALLRLLDLAPTPAAPEGDQNPQQPTPKRPVSTARRHGGRLQEIRSRPVTKPSPDRQVRSGQNHVRGKQVPQQRDLTGGKPGGGLDLQAIHNLLISRAENHPLLSMVLPECKLALKGNSLVLAAPPIHCDIIRQKEENRQLLYDTVREYDDSLKLELVPLADPGPASGRKAQAKERPPTQKRQETESVVTQWVNGEVQDLKDDDLVSLAVTLFDGKIIKRIEEGD